MSNTASPRNSILMFKPVSVAEALAALIRPRVLFRSDAAERQLITELCLRAWNIGCMHTPAEREAAAAEQPPFGLLRGSRAQATHADLLRTLVALRFQQFPYLHTAVNGTRVIPGSDTRDLAVVRHDAGEMLRIQWQPTEDQVRLMLSAVTALGPLLASLPSDLSAWLARNVAAPDIWATRASNRCRLLLLELNTCRSMVDGLNARSRGGVRFQAELEEVDSVEAHTLAFLASLCAA